MAGGLYKFGLNSLTCLFADMGLFQDTSINALGAIKLTQPAYSFQWFKLRIEPIYGIRVQNKRDTT